MRIKNILLANSLYADFQKLKNRGFWEFILTYVRVKDAIRALLWIVPAVLFLLLVASACSVLDIPFSRFSRDPMAITEGHPLYGFISNLGAILWSASAAFCLFSYTLLRSCSHARHEARFFIVGGFISLILLFDDFFMLHDSIAPVYLGISEGVIIPIYGILCFYYLLGYWDLIREKGLLLFSLAAAFFMLSILFDLLPETLLPGHHLYEDGFKFLGITSWCGFQYTVCLNQVRASLSSGEGHPEKGGERRV